MAPILLWIIIFIVSLAVLIKSSDKFTYYAEKIGIHFGLSPFVVGVIIVALGTSLPEIVSSIVAVIQGSSEIVIGNVIGSNIANIFLVLGVASIVGKNLKITHEIVQVDLPLMIGSTFILGIVIWDRMVTLPEAVICLIAFVVYILYSVKSSQQDVEIKIEMKGKMKNNLQPSVWFLLLLSGVFIYLGAKFTVNAIIELSELLRIGTEVIAVSAVALGTSLPELMVSASAAKKGKSEIAIGNVLGSNIFNALAVTGIPALLGTLTIPASMLTFSFPILVAGTLLFFFMTQDKITTQWEGWYLIVFYVLFIAKLFNLF